MLKCLSKRAITEIPVVQTSNLCDEVQQICCGLMNLEGMKKWDIPRKPGCSSQEAQGVRRKPECKKKTRVYEEN